MLLLVTLPSSSMLSTPLWSVISSHCSNVHVTSHIVLVSVYQYRVLADLLGLRLEPVLADDVGSDDGGEVA